jgi:transposase
MAARYESASREKQQEQKYFAVRQEVTLPEIKRTKEEKEAGQKDLPQLTQFALVVLASGKARLDSQKREDMLAKTEQRLGQIQGYLNQGRYKSKGYALKQAQSAVDKYWATKKLVTFALDGDDGRLTLSWQRNGKEIHDAAFLDGKYVVFFNRPALSDEEIFARFKNRDIVEKRVSHLKGPVAVRPVFLHKDDRIKGLVFVSMVAMLVYSVTEMLLRRKGLKLTGAEMKKYFRDYGGSLLTFEDQSQVVTIPHGDKWQRQVFKALGVEVAPATPVLVAGEDTNFRNATSAGEPPWSVETQGLRRAPP